MVRLDEAISITPAYVRTGVRDVLLSRYPSRSVYDATIPAFWTIGSVVHGGFLLSLLTRTATTHQRLGASERLPERASPLHLDPAHLSSQFLSASVAGPAQVEVTVVSTSKRWTRLDVELWQYDGPTAPGATKRDYTARETVRTLRIRAHYLYTQLENVYDLAAPAATTTPPAVATYLARQCPIVQHPAQLDNCEYSAIPAKFGFKDGMRWKEAECVDDGEGELRWACWFELTQGEDLTKLADLVPFFADCSKNGPEVLGQKPGQSRPAPSWYPTLTLAMDFKTSFPLPATDGSVSRTTFGLFATTKSIQAGRHDLTVEVWTSPCDLGPASRDGRQRTVEADWRKNARCVGISTQMALTTPMSFNQSKASGLARSAALRLGAVWNARFCPHLTSRDAAAVALEPSPNLLFQRLPNSPRLPAVNSAFQGERMFFQSGQTSRFRQLADEQLREKKKRARDAAAKGGSRGGSAPKPSSRFRRRLLWLVLLGALYYAFDELRTRRIPFHHPLPPPSSVALNATAASFVPSPSRQIPPFLHYVFGLHPTYGGKPFNLIYYACMTSALLTLKPRILYLHYVYPPTGFYWEEFVRNVQDSGHTKLELRKVRDVTEIYGNPVWHYAHKADIHRLEVLKEFGGTYLDVDVLVTRDLTPLYRYETVMGMESQPILESNLPPSGLCNAVILAKPYAPFITRWLESYKTFSAASWAGHSVTLPWQLAQQHPDEITVLNRYAFFWPLWHEDHLKLVHQSSSYSFVEPPSGSRSPAALLSGSQFVYHLWESFAYDDYLSRYTPDLVHGELTADEERLEHVRALAESSFAREARKWVGQGFRERWRKAKRAGLVTW
ncbi:hypothetical protein JCM11491_002382 [Sporobolomyces phaffii]